MRATRTLREAVVCMDMGAAGEVASIAQMREYQADHRSWKGSRQVAAALALASEHSRSPNETLTRLIWELDAGFPRPLVNQPVFSLDGRLLAVADLLDPVAGVVGEYDGADHRGALRHSDDVRREDVLRRHGLEMFRVTGPDLGVPPRVVFRMRAARTRARWLPAGERRWTIIAPSSWRPDRTLDDLLTERAWSNSVH